MIFITNAENELTSFRVYASLLVALDGIPALEAAAAGHPGSMILLTCESEGADGGYLNRRAVFVEKAAGWK